MKWSIPNDLALRARARQVIPGLDGMYGHLSTRLLPEDFPQYFSRGQGCRLWDQDGHEFIDYWCAFGPNLLGYNHPVVEAAVREQAALGDTLSGPGEKMVEAAELFTSLVTHAQWALFCKNGSDATSTAVVIARAHTGRRVVLAARGAYHGAQHWSVPALLSKGTLPEDRAAVVYYDYNDAQSLTEAFKAHEGDVAAVFATPFWHETFEDQALPELEFARTARQLCDDHGAVLVVDDVRAGFRLSRDCSWSSLGVQPDLSTWGKCFANGHPISAVLGAEHLRQAASEVFVTGSFWFSSVPMAATVATLKLIRDSDYLERLKQAGADLRDGLTKQASAHGFDLRQTGPAAMPQLLFNEDPDFRLGYAWVSECLYRGVLLHPYHNMFLSSAHTPQDIARTLDATDLAFEAVKRRRDNLQPSPRLMPLFQLIAQHSAEQAGSVTSTT